MRISRSTLGAVVCAADAMADLDDPADVPGVLLPTLAGLIGCDVITYNVVGLSPPEISFVDHPDGALDPATTHVFQALAHQHPLVRRFQDTGQSRALRISDLVSRWEFHRLAIYSEFFQKIPVESQLALSLPGRGGRIVGIALNRTRQDFSDTERELLDVLTEPLRSGIDRTHARSRARSAVRTADGESVDGLTDRERQVLELAARGHTNGSIGHRLGISPRTVAKHLEHAYRRLDVANRAAATFVLRSGTAPPARTSAEGSRTAS